MSHWGLQRGKPGWMGTWWHVIFWTISIIFNWKMGGFIVMGVPPNGLFISWKISLKWRIWGLFQETSIYPTFDELWAFRSWPVDYILEYLFIHVYIYILYVCMYIYILVLATCLTLHRSQDPVEWGRRRQQSIKEAEAPRGAPRGPHHRSVRFWEKKAINPRRMRDHWGN